MVLYKVEWIHSKELAKGKGKVSRNEIRFVFTVLCRNIHDAHRCLDYYFNNFIANYLLLDGMREPIYLTDPCSNLLRASRIFGEPRRYV